MAKKYERMEDLPPVLQELLKKRGWTYPPSEEMKKEWREAAERFCGSVHTDPEIVEAMWEEDNPGWFREWKEKHPAEYRRWKEEATARYQQWQRQQEQEKEQGNAR
jgi:hypothetical protein